MNKIQSQVKEFMLAARQECPDSPRIPSLEDRKLRARLILEEALEFIEASGLSLRVNQECFSQEYPCPEGPLSMEDFEVVESENPPNIIEIADAVSDLNYVSYGAANTYGIDMEEIEDCVHKNNMSKFEDDWIDDHGKLRKGPNYKPVDLSKFFPSYL